MQFAVAVIGSRSFSNYEQLARVLDALVAAEARPLNKLVSGGSVGADALGAHYAQVRGIFTRIIRPDYRVYGRAAPLVRNGLIMDELSLPHWEQSVVVAFWDGASRGTVHALREARKRGLQVILVEPQP